MARSGRGDEVPYAAKEGQSYWTAVPLAGFEKAGFGLWISLDGLFINVDCVFFFLGGGGSFLCVFYLTNGFWFDFFPSMAWFVFDRCA